MVNQRAAYCVFLASALAAVNADAGTLNLELVSSSHNGIAIEPFQGDTALIMQAFNGGRVLLHDASVPELGTVMLDRIPDPDGDFAGVSFDIAVAPDYDTSGKLYISYGVNTNPPGSTPSQDEVQLRVIELTRDATDPTKLDPASSRLIFEATFPEAGNVAEHTGGSIDFGPDGMLYIATGDGDADFTGVSVAQDVTDSQGKIFRIDPAAPDALPDDPRQNYGLPSDNPDFGTDAVPGLWAVGLRNPYQIRWDLDRDKLYVTDVGESDWEEINIGAAGANFGWSAYEGRDAGPGVAPLSIPGTLTDPFHIYAHGNDLFEGHSIVGGLVYEGADPALAALKGQYIFGDWGSDSLSVGPRDSMWSFSADLDRVGSSDVTAWDLTYSNGGQLNRILGIGETPNGHLLVSDLDRNLFRITSATVAATVPLPAAGGLLVLGLGGLILARRRA